MQVSGSGDVSDVDRLDNFFEGAANAVPKSWREGGRRKPEVDGVPVDGMTDDMGGFLLSGKRSSS